MLKPESPKPGDKLYYRGQFAGFVVEPDEGQSPNICKFRKSGYVEGDEDPFGCFIWWFDSDQTVNKLHTWGA